MFERTIDEGFKNDFASVWGYNERFRLTTSLPSFGVLAHGPDIRYRRGAREGVRANEFVDHVCHPPLVKPEVPWLLHDLLWGTSGLDERGLHRRDRVRFEARKAAHYSTRHRVVYSRTCRSVPCLPLRLSSHTTASAFARTRSTTATLAPASPNAWAKALPIPCPPPVT